MGSQHQGRRGDFQTLLNPDNYVEEPRPNLFNVVKKLREHDNKKGYKRLVYVAKINENEAKGELEKEITNFFKKSAEDREFSGLNLILGGYCVHFLEGEIAVVNHLLQALNSYAKQANSIYANIWVLHQIEECKEKIYSGWMCKNIVVSGSSREIKALPQSEKIWTIYESFLDIGKQVSAVQSKGVTQINQTIKTAASEQIPSGDELQSAVGETEMTLQEYLEFIGEPPDILLEKELIWPVEPDLIY